MSIWFINYGHFCVTMVGAEKLQHRSFDEQEPMDFHAIIQ